MTFSSPNLNNLIDNWIDEDIGRGDLTKLILGKQIVSAYWISKHNGIFCGGEIVSQIFKKIDNNTQVTLLIKDGQKFTKDQKLLELQGTPQSLLAGERISLNIAMHLSGISTKTSELVDAIRDSKIRLADTRKTTPGLRVFEKYAVRCGGGVNHRMGLDDAAMLKENHIAWSGGITASVHALRISIPWTTKIIVEAETKEQAEEAARAGVDGILLDEMPPEEVKSLVPRLRSLALRSSLHNQQGSLVIELSGINPKKIKSYASTGVDLISSSAPITQSNWIDFSMRFNEEI